MRKLSILNPVPINMHKLSTATQYYNMKNLEKIDIAVAQNTKADLDFKGYKNQDNKNRIRAISNGCCGYCGVRIDEHNTTVVEHFKPKAELHFRINELRLEGVDKPIAQRLDKFEMYTEKCLYGYFMDGNYAENLLPACSACNTGVGSNGTFVHNKKMKGNIEYKIPYGKKNYFPILYSKRNRFGKLYDHRMNELYISNIELDKSLLFNPYKDDPYELFSVAFDDTFVASNGVGHIIKITPNKYASKFKHLKAEVSINLLGLNRENLCIARYDKYKALDNILLGIDEAIIIRNFKLNTWSKFALDFSKEFNIDNSQMIGYGEYIGKKTGYILRDIIIKKFPIPANGILNHTISFIDLVNELSIFSQQHYIPGLAHQTAKNIQERILMGL